MIRKSYFLIITISILSACQHKSVSTESEWTKVDQGALLQTLGQNMLASITDITESQRKPTNEFVLTTHYPLSDQEIEALQSIEGKEGSFGTGLVDGIKCAVTNISLHNETGAEMVLADTIQYPIYLQRFGMWNHEDKLSQNLGIPIRLNSQFSSLKGNMSLKLQFGEDTEELIQIPVEINISDVL